MTFCKSSTRCCRIGSLLHCGLCSRRSRSALEFRDLRIETARPGLQLVYPRATWPARSPTGGRPRAGDRFGVDQPGRIQGDFSAHGVAGDYGGRKPALNLQAHSGQRHYSTAGRGRIHHRGGHLVPSDIRRGPRPGRFGLSLAATLDAAQAQRLARREPRGAESCTRLPKPPNSASRPMTGTRAGRFHIRAPATPHRYRQADGHFPGGREPGAGSFSGGAEEGRVRDRLAPRGDCGQKDGRRRRSRSSKAAASTAHGVGGISLLFDCSDSMAMAGLINPTCSGRTCSTSTRT